MLPHQTNLHPAILAYRVRAIDQRLSALARLPELPRLTALEEHRGVGGQLSQREQELHAERSTLRALRAEAMRLLGGQLPKVPKRPRDSETKRRIRVLQSELRSRAEKGHFLADRWEGEGDYRHARTRRLQLITDAEDIIRECDLDPALLQHCDPPKLGQPKSADAAGDIGPIPFPME